MKYVKEFNKLTKIISDHLRAKGNGYDAIGYVNSEKNRFVIEIQYLFDPDKVRRVNHKAFTTNMSLKGLHCLFSEWVIKHNNQIYNSYVQLPIISIKDWATLFDMPIITATQKTKNNKTLLLIND